MKANYKVAEGDLKVIRPLVYVREKVLRDFAETNKLPIIAENCPACFEQPKVRLMYTRVYSCILMYTRTLAYRVLPVQCPGVCYYFLLKW